jgi:hypothetical protein
VVSVDDGLVLPDVPAVDGDVEAFDRVKFPLWPARQPVTVTVLPLLE